MSRLSLRRTRLLIAFALWIVPAVVSADSVTLAWDPSVGATGYTVRWGTAQGVYPNSADAGNSTTFVINGLTTGGTYWTVVQAYNGTGVSDYSLPLQFTVGTACSYSISPTAANAPFSGTGGSITVTTQSGCTWSATTASTFLTFQNGTGRTGTGTVSYSVAANSVTTSRTATATVAGQTFTVSQAAAPAPTCTYSISPVSVSVSDTATTGTITVTTQDGCAWSASSFSAFLTFPNGSGRTGPGTVTFNVAANTLTVARTGSATVAGKSFSVSQAAPPQACSYTINPLSANAPAAGMTGTISVTTQTGCAWSASSAAGYLTFPNGSGRVGTGTVSYVVAANNTGNFRSATASVAGKSFTLWQAGTTCTYSISPATLTASAAGGSGTVTVTTQSGCAWTALSLNMSLTFQNGSGRTGPGTVGFTVTENLSTARNLPGLVAGLAFTVAQAGAAGTAPPIGLWTSDFYADGKNDILVRDSVVGTVEAWFLDNATVKGRQTLSHTLDMNWMLVGRGDFNADGKPDVVWQHRTDGHLFIWYMDGTNMTAAVAPSIILIGDPEWKIVGVGDFNSDGHPDLAWQRSADGQVGVWLMDGVTVTSTPFLIPDRAADPLWKVVGVGDFNADGKSDLLWRHMGTGEMGAWLMNGISRVIHAPLSPISVPDQNWQVGAVTDANGDGKPDIVWQHTDGSIMIWHMSGTSRTTYPVVPTLVPLGWFLAGPR